MKRLIASVGWRYLSVLVQFVIVSAVARQLDIATAGQYFALFGIVAVFYALSGLGVPDGLVRHLSAAGPRGGLGRILGLMVLCNLVIALPLAGISLTVLRQDIDLMVWLALWWFAYATVFSCAQILVGLGRPTMGAFFFYCSITLCYLPTVLPYLFLAEHPDLMGVLCSAAVGSMLAFGMAILAVCRAMSAPTNPEQDALRFSDLLMTGFPILLTRVMQSSLPWIPVWILTAFGSLEEAAIYSAASRLTVVVTSVVAALRFVSRNDIVALCEKRQFADLVRLSHRVSVLSASPPILALVFLAIWGPLVVPFVLGSEYTPAVNVLMVLVLGVFAEAYGGLSDEILKMTGHTRIVIISLGSSIVLQIFLTFSLAPQGAFVVAWATVLAFTMQYIWQVFWLTSRTPIKLLSTRVYSRE